ncbi:inner centromere protein-like [Centropristis striata]|uniref:inner centromere protein-like n=1 Tax=Centropristis striata TaxID=184440 RepID=UPI0027E209A3|nr:inner centromere protein-like [Centropristis striata]
MFLSPGTNDSFSFPHKPLESWKKHFAGPQSGADMYSSPKKPPWGDGPSFCGDSEPPNTSEKIKEEERCCPPAESKDEDRQRQSKRVKTRTAKEIVQFWLGIKPESSPDTDPSSKKFKPPRASSNPSVTHNAPRKRTGRDRLETIEWKDRRNCRVEDKVSLEQVKREREKREDEKRQRREQEERERKEKERERQVRREREKREDERRQRREQEERERKEKEERIRREKKMREGERERQEREKVEEERQRRMEERGRQKREREEREIEEKERKESDKRESRRREKRERRRSAAVLSRIHLGWLQGLKAALSQDIELNILQENFLRRSEPSKRAEIRRLRNRRREQFELRREVEEKVKKEKKKQKWRERKEKKMMKKRDRAQNGHRTKQGPSDMSRET